MTFVYLSGAGNYSNTKQMFIKLTGMWNTMHEVAGAMIEVSKNGYHKAAIECRDICKLVRQK